MRLDLAEWIAGTDARLAEHIAAIGDTDGLVVAAYAETTVLNWGWLGEVFAASMLVGTAPDPLHDWSARARPMKDLQLHDLAGPAPARPFALHQPLAIQNLAHPSSKALAFWLAFSPLAAATLGWQPLPNEPGTWTTAAGDVAVRSIWWVDGHPCHTGRAFDDSEGGGMFVLATLEGAGELEAIGPLTRISSLRRSGHDGGSNGTTTDDKTAMFAEIFEEIDPSDAQDPVYRGPRPEAS